MMASGSMAAAIMSKHVVACMAKSNATTTMRCVSALPTNNFLPSSSIIRSSENNNNKEGGNTLQKMVTRPSRNMIVCQTNAHYSNISSSSSSSSSTAFSNSYYSSKRYLSSSPPSTWGEEYEGILAKRNKSIKMHPDGFGRRILPGNYVMKKNKKTGIGKRVFLEHALGYFWAIKELELTDKKPILSNETLISAAEAETFPALKELVNLNDEAVDIPEFFTRNNRSKDASAQCTLVAISCKDFGAKLLPSWTEPFEKALHTGKDADRYEVVRITINEGRIAKLLSPFIASGAKKTVSEKDYANTLLYYGDAEDARDILRMHNIYTSYVFLVDGIGRVRWAGSGEGSEEEVGSMIEFAKLLTEPSKRVATKQKQSMPRVGKKVNSM